MRKPLSIPMRTILFVFALCVVPCALSSAALDEAHFRGKENFQYDVRVTYKPMAPTQGYPNTGGTWTVIDSLRVVLNGRLIRIPQSATADLFWPHTPSPPYAGPDNTLRFKISCSSGEKSYDAVFVFSGERLIEREINHHGGEETITKYPEQQDSRKE